jgi:hypothetical protein
LFDRVGACVNITCVGLFVGLRVLGRRDVDLRGVGLKVGLPDTGVFAGGLEVLAIVGGMLGTLVL